MNQLPIAYGNNVFKQRGYSYLWWGTEALGSGLSLPGDNFYIVASAKQSQVADTINLPQVSGLNAVSINVIDGARWNFTVIEDTNVLSPVVGQVVALENVFLDYAGDIAPNGITPVTVGYFKIENADFNAEIKQYGRREIVAQSYPCMDGTLGADIAGGGNPSFDDNQPTINGGF
jgi:hypothetical protein